jgi:hypothetical protein
MEITNMQREKEQPQRPGEPHRKASRNPQGQDKEQQKKPFNK